jgi:hypothetical protein
MGWEWVYYLIASLVISFALQKKPQSQPPPVLSDIKAPTAEEGREIPVLFGTRDVESPNVVWYGDLRTVPVKSKGGKK